MTVSAGVSPSRYSVRGDALRQRVAREWRMRAGARRSVSVAANWSAAFSSTRPAVRARLRLAFPVNQAVGVHIVTFEACSGCTRVTARALAGGGAALSSKEAEETTHRNSKGGGLPREPPGDTACSPVVCRKRQVTHRDREDRGELAGFGQEPREFLEVDAVDRLERLQPVNRLVGFAERDGVAVGHLLSAQRRSRFTEIRPDAGQRPRGLSDDASGYVASIHQPAHETKRSYRIDLRPRYQILPSSHGART